MCWWNDTIKLWTQQQKKEQKTKQQRQNLKYATRKNIKYYGHTFNRRIKLLYGRSFVAVCFFAFVYIFENSMHSRKLFRVPKHQMLCTVQILRIQNSLRCRYTRWATTSDTDTFLSYTLQYTDITLSYSIYYTTYINSIRNLNSICEPLWTWLRPYKPYTNSRINCVYCV